VRFWTHDRFGFPLPPGHRFPLPKYALLREGLVASGIAAAGDLHESPPAAWDALAAVHDRGFLARVREGRMGVRELRAFGLPWSDALVERARRATQGTVEAARDALRTGHGMNLGGGTHHAHHAAARGYCLFNDVAVAIAALRGERTLGRVLVVDCDVHQGDGTAELLAGDDAAFTLSIQGRGNYPLVRATSDLDVELPDGTGDDAYLSALRDALRRAVPAARPDLIVFLAGADPWEGDALGRLSLTTAGLRARDALVLDTAESHGTPVCVTLAGGYAPHVGDTVEINLATARLVAQRAGTITLAVEGP
jgi:acetoin utilization deacetylase AcuC-like enzyme